MIVNETDKIDKPANKKYLSPQKQKLSKNIFQDFQDNLENSSSIELITMKDENKVTTRYPLKRILKNAR